jgi:hypothetical protein
VARRGGHPRRRRPRARVQARTPSCGWWMSGRCPRGPARGPAGADGRHRPRPGDRRRRRRRDDSAAGRRRLRGRSRAERSGDQRANGTWKPGEAPSQALRWAVEGLAKAGTLSIIGVYPPTMEVFPIGAATNKNLTLRMQPHALTAGCAFLAERARVTASEPAPTGCGTSRSTGVAARCRSGALPRPEPRLRPLRSGSACAPGARRRGARGRSGNRRAPRACAGAA